MRGHLHPPTFCKTSTAHYTWKYTVCIKNYIPPCPDTPTLSIIPSPILPHNHFSSMKQLYNVRLRIYQASKCEIPLQHYKPQTYQNLTFRPIA